MNTIQSTYIMSVLMAFSILNSCEKMIEVEDPINQISTQQVFSDANTANAALNNLYLELQANSLFSGSNRGAGALLGTYADDLDAYFPPSSMDNLNMHLNQVVPTNSVVLSVWNNAYKEIYTANAIIEGIDHSTGIADSDKRRIKGEAILVRTMVYFNLQRIFGDVPYTTVTDYEINRKLSKLPSAELLMKLEQDINLAVSLLQDSYRNAERIYLNKKAAQLVQANILLNAGKYSEAEVVCKNILASPLYAIQQDVTKVFKKSSTNIVWQLKPINANQSVPETGIYFFSSAPPIAYALSSNLISTFESTDLRKQKWTTPLSAGGVTFYRNDKYRNFVTNADEYSVVMRIEEVHFILGEALAKQNKVSEAATYINTIRTRSGVSAFSNTLTPQAFMTELLKEKRREFFAEQGLRFFDLKRNNSLASLAMVKPSWQTYHQLWPLPQNEIILNPNLNPQNNGY